jgi:hypothetical protein
MDDDDINKAKLKWWERSVLARTSRSRNKGGSNASHVEDEEEEDGKRERPGAGPGRSPEEVEAEPPLATPGAVAVHGPGYRGDVEDDGRDTSTVRVGGGGAGVDEASEAPPFHVDSYAVHHQGPTDDEIRQQILAGTAHAEAVPKTNVSDARQRSRTWWAAVLLGAVVVAAAIAVAIAVPLSAKQNQQSAGTQQPYEDVLASVYYIEWQGQEGGFASATRAKTSILAGSGGTPTTTGATEVVLCGPKACIPDPLYCQAGAYEPGCCAGLNCPNTTKCGSRCPNPPKSCYLTDPTNKSCVHPDCYTCNQENGEDAYVLTNLAFAIDCLEVGTAIRPENGETYKWAILCGPMISGFDVKANRDEGDYQCGAMRSGANYSDDDGGLLGVIAPCKFIALLQCGCGPSDMYTFGWPDPTGPCLPGGDCPFLCEDAGVKYASNVCRNFPGNISWWEGKNAFNGSWIGTNSLAPEYELEIYIKGVDDVN